MVLNMSDAYVRNDGTSLVEVTKESLYTLQEGDFMAKGSISRTVFGGELEDFDTDDMIDCLIKTTLSALIHEQGAKVLDIIPVTNFHPEWAIVEKPNEIYYTWGNSLAYRHFGQKLTITLTVICGGFNPDIKSSNEYHQDILKTHEFHLPQL